MSRACAHAVPVAVGIALALTALGCDGFLWTKVRTAYPAEPASIERAAFGAKVVGCTMSTADPQTLELRCPGVNGPIAVVLRGGALQVWCDQADEADCKAKGEDLWRAGAGFRGLQPPPAR